MPAWVGISMVLGRLGFDPFSVEELGQLSVASAPVASKWAPFVLPYMAELTLAGTVLWIMAPKVKKREEDRRKQLDNKRAAQTPPALSPPKPGVRPQAPPTTHAARHRPGDIPVLPEARLEDGPKIVDDIPPVKKQAPDKGSLPAPGAAPEVPRGPGDIPLLPEAGLDGPPVS